MPRDLKRIKFPKKKNRKDIYTAIFVPSTNKQQKRISKAAFRKRALETMRFLSRFGGYTTYQTHGGYLMPNKKLLKEPVAKVESYTTPRKYRRQQNNIRAFLKDKARKWGQESIGYIFEEELHFIKPGKQRRYSQKQRAILRRRIRKIKPWKYKKRKK